MNHSRIGIQRLQVGFEQNCADPVVTKKNGYSDFFLLKMNFIPLQLKATGFQP
jgi:hypothetical protein